MLLVERLTADGSLVTVRCTLSLSDALNEMRKLVNRVANTVAVIVRDRGTRTIVDQVYVSADGTSPSTATGKRFHTPYPSHLRRPCKLHR